MKKGISSTISIVLTILITISIIIIAYSYLSNTISSSSETAQKETIQKKNLMASQFIIENIYQDKVTLRNIGKSEISDITFYVNYIMVNHTGQLPIPINGASTFTINLSEIYEPTELKVVSGLYKMEMNMIYFLSDKDICQIAETYIMCDGLDVVYGNGYQETCCSEHNLCC